MIRRLFLAGAGSALLGGCAGLSEEDRRARWPPIGDFIEVNGGKVHYWDRGEGQPVILIHGASGNLRDWTFALAPEIAKKHRVIAFDRPGLGYSERLPEHGWDPARQAAHLSQATRLLGAERPIVVGHSWGGALAMGWALNESSDLAGIVTLGGATMPWGGDLSFFYALAASDVTGPAIGRVVNAVVSEERIASFLETTFAPQSVPTGYADYVGGPLATRPSTVRHNARDLTNLDQLLRAQSKRYVDISTPVEIIHGELDATVSPKLHAEGMHALLPRSRLTLLKNTGHMPHHARPDALFEAIDRLVA